MLLWWLNKCLTFLLFMTLFFVKFFVCPCLSILRFFILSIFIIPQTMPADLSANHQALQPRHPGLLSQNSSLPRSVCCFVKIEIRSSEFCIWVAFDRLNAELRTPENKAGKTLHRLTKSKNFMHEKLESFIVNDPCREMAEYNSEPPQPEIRKHAEIQSRTGICDRTSSG